MLEKRVETISVSGWKKNNRRFFKNCMKMKNEWNDNLNLKASKSKKKRFKKQKKKFKTKQKR